VKKIPKRYRKLQQQQPTASLLGMTFKWNEKVWKVTGLKGTVALIRSGTLTSKIDIAMLPKVAEVIAA